MERLCHLRNQGLGNLCLGLARLKLLALWFLGKQATAMTALMVGLLLLWMVPGDRSGAHTSRPCAPRSP